MIKLRQPRLSARFLALSMTCISLSAGCVSELDEERGTETGNPPVMQPKLDETLVKLVVTTEGVRIEGEKNAATPNAKVEITSALTGQVFRGPVAADGSFGVDVNGSKLDTYAVRVVADGKTSPNTVYVAPGAAAVESSTQGGALSCEQRSSLARQQLDAVIDGGNRHCLIDSDCTTRSSGSACNDSCSVYPIANVGLSEVDAAQSAIEAGLCKTFAQDGCKVLALPCVPPNGQLACIAGTCTLAKPGCTEPFAAGSPTDYGFAGYWYSPAAQACLPRSFFGVVGSGGNRYTDLASCEASCQPKPSRCGAERKPARVCVLHDGPTCNTEATVCAQPCATSAQCVGDPVGNTCVKGFCAAAGSEDYSTDGMTLSCEQRTNQARMELDALVASISANDPYATSCRIDSDCKSVSSGSSCNDSCSVYALSNAGAQQIETAKQTIKDGLCKDFSADGCNYAPLPCIPPQGEVACAGSVTCALVQRDGSACQSYMFCARGERLQWPLCQHALGPEPHEALEMICVANETGKVALSVMHGDIAITNRGWSHSAYGRFPSTLSPDAELDCAIQKRSFGDNNPAGALSCWN